MSLIPRAESRRVSDCANSVIFLPSAVKLWQIQTPTASSSWNTSIIFDPCVSVSLPAWTLHNSGQDSSAKFASRREVQIVLVPSMSRCIDTPSGFLFHLRANDIDARSALIHTPFVCESKCSVTIYECNLRINRIKFNPINSKSFLLDRLHF